MPLPEWLGASHDESHMERKGHKETVLAGKVREIQRAVAEDSPTKLARLLNDVPLNETGSRTDELGRRIETDRRMIGRWLAADALMDTSSRARLLTVANRALQARGDTPFPDDFMEVTEPDPVDVISRKLDLLLAHFRLRPGEPSYEEALRRLEQDASEPPGRAEPLHHAGDS